MRVATVDGLVTLFYDGSKELLNFELDQEWLDAYYANEEKDNWEEWNLSNERKKYWKERQTWEQVIVVEGVSEIPLCAFNRCRNLKRVIMANTVVRIEWGAFGFCNSLSFVKLSLSLEHIDWMAFYECDLFSVFIPPRCIDIGEDAFSDNKNLTILSVPRLAHIRHSAFGRTRMAGVDEYVDEELHDRLKNVNNDEKYSLHTACSSCEPLEEVIMTIILQHGIGAFNFMNEMGITPSQYLEENPYTAIKEMDILRHYVMKMMGGYD